MQRSSNSVGFCQEICISFNCITFAIKGNLCRCLEQTPKDVSLVPFFCNTSCSQPGTRMFVPYFNECGGNGTYSVYKSGAKDERIPKLNDIFCVAIQCSTTNSSIYFEKSCSELYPPVCQKEVETNQSGTWSDSMDICKSMSKSSYLLGGVFLNDINRSCKLMREELINKSWIGVANEVYVGNDRGIAIGEEEKALFLQCQLCSYVNSTYKECIFMDCTRPEKISLICGQMDQNEKRESLSGSTVRSSTVDFYPPKSNTSTESMTYFITNTPDNIETITPISTRERTTSEGIHSNDNDEAFKTTIPISIAAVIGGIFFVLIFIYLWYWKKRHQIGILKKKSKHEQIKVSNVAGIVNTTYFTIEFKEQGIILSDMEEKIENPYIQAEDETYHHLREKDSSKKKYDNECNYDTTKNSIEKTEKYNHNSEGTYDRLGDKRCNTIADDTYHHACTVKKDRSDYDVTEVRKQYILDSLYNHVEIVQNENDTEQDTVSNFSETQNEDHTYFILEQN